MNTCISSIDTYNTATHTAKPGIIILSGVFNQDGSNAPYLQPIVVNVNPSNKTPPNAKRPNQEIPTYSSEAFFQLYNNYNCASVQLYSQSTDYQGTYHVLVGGVSYFFSEKPGMYVSRSQEAYVRCVDFPQVGARRHMCVV